MAGGGVKVAFQAGVLQVWLDEAKVGFDHADGASGGVFNLAMWCQGMSGTQIANNWRTYRPSRGLEPNLRQLWCLPFGESLFRLRRFRRNVFSAWGLSWPEIRSTTREATFNLYTFSRHQHLVLEPKDMDEDRLVSAASLPMWFPPVRIDGDTYIDAVFVTDANLMEAIQRGAEEVWIIWTVSERGEWQPGFVSHYFQMIEAMANGKLRADLKRIQHNNEAIDRADHGIALPSADELAPSDAHRSIRTDPTTVSFTEEMAGHLGLGDHDYQQGERNGQTAQTALMFRLTITVEDVDRFIVDPQHEAVARGWASCEALGGRLSIERGVFNLFVDQADPKDKRMLYQLWFQDGTGHKLTLTGHKIVQDHLGFDLWKDTTTLYTHIIDGYVTPAGLNGHTVVGAGVLRISPSAFARQLTTFRATGSTKTARVVGLARFTRLFTGSLWDVYERDILSSSPF